mgnify:CR=1 FL=1
MPYLLPILGIGLLSKCFGDQPEKGKKSPTFACRDYKVVGQYPWRHVVSLALVFVVPILLAFAVTQQDIVRLFYRRYLIVLSGLPALIAGLLVGGMLAPRWRRVTAAISLTIAVACVGPLVQWRANGKWIRRSREDWRAAVAILNAHARPDDVIYVASDLIESDRLHDPSESRNERFRSYCQLPLTGFYPLRNDVELVVVPMHRVSAFVRERKELPKPDWIVTRRHDPARVAAMVPAGWTQKTYRERSPTVVGCE